MKTEMQLPRRGLFIAPLSLALAYFLFWPVPIDPAATCAEPRDDSQRPPERDTEPA